MGQADLVSEHWSNPQRRIRSGSNNCQSNVLVDLGREEGGSSLVQRSVVVLLDDVVMSVNATVHDTVVRFEGAI